MEKEIKYPGWASSEAKPYIRRMNADEVELLGRFIDSAIVPYDEDWYDDSKDYHDFNITMYSYACMAVAGASFEDIAKWMAGIAEHDGRTNGLDVSGMNFQLVGEAIAAFARGWVEHDGEVLWKLGYSID
ncbi:hypothetical protein [uncultured Selenomonas sp.]|uniref:hypothetical protein n=1 Tax=uncultured Selenomonas sp. TaxID=159275 RepID=UPI0025E2839B|nr:hypothetical protein [uncultured Selenomonas sp.]